MKLSYRCQSCKKDNFIKTNSTNRHELLMELGKNEINERCKHCGSFTKKHINRLYAEKDYKMVLIGIAISVLITALLWKFGLIASISLAIPIWFWVAQNKKASDFNRTMVK